MFELKLGDLQIFSTKTAPPAKLIKALAIVADRLHPAFDAKIPAGKSKESCVLCSLTIRDFLRAVGFTARVESVCFIAKAARNGTQLHSVAIGVPNSVEEIPGRWNGHLVTVVADWLKQLSGMMAIPVWQIRDEWRGRL
jgi:hypothetical protein